MSYITTASGDYYPGVTSHTCWSRCPNCWYHGATTRTEPFPNEYTTFYTVPTETPKIDPRARWFDAFRRWDDLVEPAAHDAWGQVASRNLRFVAAADRRKRKRKAWLQRLLAL